MKIVQRPSVHFEERKYNKTPQLLIMHYTDTQDIEETLNVLNQNNTSAHYCVDDDGRIFQLVDESKRAWHAGISYWQGEKDINSSSIGIEIQNPGHRGGYKPFAKKQIAALIELAKDIMERNNIAPQNVIGHSDIAPNRKQDPGEYFPWKELGANGIGIWAEPSEEEKKQAHDIYRNEAEVARLLEEIGYAPKGTFNNATEPTLEQVVKAFQRHYLPEVFFYDDKSLIGEITPMTVAMLIAYINKVKKLG